MVAFFVIAFGLILGLFVERMVEAIDVADQNGISWSDAFWLLDNSVNNRKSIWS